MHRVVGASLLLAGRRAAVRSRRGRRTHYELQPNQHFRHPATAAHEVDELLRIFVPEPRPGE